jgi:hypothetical protein
LTFHTHTLGMSGSPLFPTVSRSAPGAARDPHAVFGQHTDMLAQPVRLDADVALQRLGDLVQDRAPAHLQRGRFVMGQQLAREDEAEGLPAADPHRGQAEGLVGQPEAVPGLVVIQRGALLVAQESRSRATVRRETPNSPMKSLLLGR